LIEDDQADIEHRLAVINAIHAEVIQGVNLEKHLPDCEDAINYINKNIDETIAVGGKTAGYSKLKNEIYRSIYDIKERL
jgi:hypothetical protein